MDIIATMLGLAASGTAWVAFQHEARFAKLAKIAMLALGCFGFWISGYTFGNNLSAEPLPEWLGISLCTIMIFIWLMAWLPRFLREKE